MRRLRLDWRPGSPGPTVGKTTIYAAADGSLKQVAEDGTESDLGGASPGGSQPLVERVQANTPGPVDPMANPGILNWGHASGDALLSYTDPSTPTFVEAGIYSITVMVNTGAAQPGEFCNVEYSPGNGDSIGSCIPLSDPTGSGDASLGAIVISVTAGETIQLHLWLSAGADPISDVGMLGTVVKLG